MSSSNCKIKSGNLRQFVESFPHYVLSYSVNLKMKVDEDVDQTSCFSATMTAPPSSNPGRILPLLLLLLPLLLHICHTVVSIKVIWPLLKLPLKLRESLFQLKLYLFLCSLTPL